MEQMYLKKLINKGLSTRGIAHEVKKSQTSVCYWLNKYGLKTNKQHAGGRRADIKNKQCKNCSILVKNRNQYCSMTCQSDHKYKKFIIRWKEGREDGMCGEYGLSRYIKKYVFDKFHSRCSECNWDKINIYSNRKPLEIDHIDGNYQNNTEENLRLLCPNCHSLTPTFKALNKGGGRKNRKKYYKLAD